MTQTRPILNKRFLFASSPQHEEVYNAIKAVNRRFERDLGAAYYGMIIRGSRTLGYATPESDLDVSLIYDEHKLDRLAARRAAKGKPIFGTRLETGIDNELLKRLVAARLYAELPSTRIRIDNRFNAPMHSLERNLKETPTLGTTSTTAGLFGLSCGRRINEARLRAVEAVLAGPNPEATWQNIRSAHETFVLTPAATKFHRFLNQFQHDPGEPRGIDAAVQLIEQRSKQYSLPPLKQMHERLVGAVRPRKR